MSEEEHPIAKFVRLNNGDDIIAEVVETEDEDGILYTVFHPLKVVYIPSETSGYLQIAFMPWVFPRICDKQEFTIFPQDVIMVAEVSKKMNTYYWENVADYLSPKPTQAYEPREDDNKINEADLAEILKEISAKRTYH